MASPLGSGGMMRREPAKFDQIKLRLFNPFGEPTQVEVTKQFTPQGKSFAMDMDFGKGLAVL